MNPTLKIPAHTRLGQRAINPAHKQRHGRRVLGAAFYTIQRRYASYCLVPSCLAGTQPESCTNTLGSCRLYLYLLWQAQPSRSRVKAVPPRGFRSRSCPAACAGAFPNPGCFPKAAPGAGAHPCPLWLRPGRAAGGNWLLLAQETVTKGHRADLHEHQVSLASAVPGCSPDPSRPQERHLLTPPFHRVIKAGKDL